MRTLREADENPQNAFEWAIYYFGAFAMLGLTAVLLYIVGARYLFNRPPIWSEDLPRIMFVWMVFVCGGLAIRLGLNIRVVSLTAKLPKKQQLAVRIFSHLLVLCFLFVFGYYTVDMINLNLSGTILSLGWSNAVFSIPLLVGAVIMFAYQARLLALAVLALAGRIELVETDGAAGGAGLG